MKKTTVTISKAAKLLNMTSHTLKSWEIAFTPILSIQRDQNHARKFTAENLQVLKRIKELKNEGNSDEEIIQLIIGEKERIYERELQREEVEACNRTVDKRKEEESIQNEMAPMLEQLEGNIVSQVRKAVKEEMETITTKQTRIHSSEISSLSHKVDTLREVSEFEREFYQEELEKERDLFKEKVSEREEKFISFVQERLRNRTEVKEQQPKYFFNFLKNLLNFAK
ncbi:MerR family transcriptional regulator [Bacillus spongiae]|uniref:MerR family transcriptional regulator n=1 Tax=Bacillus spongiae TaxID=2683610 RepID=A0ABU8HBS5_9BACI